MALFQASIFSESTYSSDQPVKTTFRLTNHSQETMRVLKWFTPLEGMWSDCLLVIRNGERVPYDGRLAKRGTPASEDYVTLGTGEFVEETVAIDEAYQVSDPGVYNVSVDTEIHAVAVAELNKFAAMTADTREAEAAMFKRALRQPVPNAATNFVVNDTGGRLTTEGERARKRQKAGGSSLEMFKVASGTALKPQFNGGDATKRTDAEKAHFEGYKLAQNALSALKNDNVYAEWFGTHSQSRFQAVHDHYSNIVNDMEQKIYTYDLTLKGCRPGVYAYTYKNSTTIWLCDQFWASPMTGTDSKAGTIVHEHSHASSGTDDLAYGQANCRQLAINDPDKAIRNADSHEYYAQG
jgi:peptidyl-Lys metalloendopeptidase